jgi:DNA-binding transcriptional MerR regulator
MAIEKIEALLEDLKQQRDELRLQMHLAKAEAQEEWDKLEDKWEDIRPKLEVVKGHTAEASREAWGALEQAGEAIKKGYQRIRRDLD